MSGIDFRCSSPFRGEAAARDPTRLGVQRIEGDRRSMHVTPGHDRPERGLHARPPRRARTDAHPDAFLPDLAMALNNQSAHLSALGRREPALTAIEEAVTIRRRLADAPPDALLPDLAPPLPNQPCCVRARGRRQPPRADLEG